MNTLSVKTKFLNRLRSSLQNPKIEEILYKAVRGQSVTSALARIVPNHYQYPAQTLRKVKRHNLNFELDLSDLMEWSLFYDFSESSIENLLNLCKPGNVVIDVGSNAGALLMKISNKVGPTGRAFGFEPHPTLYAKCLKNLSLNEIKNVAVTNVGLSDSESSAWMSCRDPHNHGKTQVSTTPTDTVIKLTTLDLYCSQNNITQVDVIKIDVEGFETHVINGARLTLQQFRPKLFIEIDDQHLRRQDSSPAEIFKILQPYGYKFLAAETLKPLNLNQTFDLCHFDIIGEV